MIPALPPGALLGLVLAPLVGAAGVAVLPEGRPDLARALALAVAGGVAALALAVAVAFDPAAPGPQLVAALGWTVQPGVPSTLGIDGLSLPFVLLVAALTPVLVGASRTIEVHVRSWHAWMLTLEAALFGVFLAQDWALFQAAWELTLVPLFFLVGRWGGERRGQAGLTFLQFTMGGSVFTLLALLWLMGATGAPGLSMRGLAAAAAGLSPEVQAVALATLAIGFLVKLPAAPLHGWLPLAYAEAPAPATMAMSGLLAKMAVYGLLRSTELLPAGAALLAPAAAALGTFGVAHGGLMAWRQDDLKRMVAWSSYAHMSFMLAAWATLSPVGWRGLLLQVVAHGVVAPMLFLLVDLVEREQGTRSLAQVGRVSRGLAVGWGVGLAASVSLPGFAGFPGELHAAMATWAAWSPLTPVLLLGALLWTATGLRALDRLVFGGVAGAVAAGAGGRWERAALVPLLVAAVALGWAPDAVTGASMAAVQRALDGAAIGVAVEAR